MQPRSVTFTGVDARTDLEKLVCLSKRYPCEWGVLFSPNRQGQDNRYPDDSTLDRILAVKGLKLAAHLCGKHAEKINSGDFYHGLPLEHFERVQVNHKNPNAKMLAEFSKFIGKPVIAQWRDPVSFPVFRDNIEWLYDASGGRGERPDSWPTNPHKTVVGFAGGINPDNVLDINTMLSSNSATGYWLDMESGVRTDNWFDVLKVWKVLVALYSVKELPNPSSTEKHSHTAHKVHQS